MHKPAHQHWPVQYTLKKTNKIQKNKQNFSHHARCCREPDSYPSASVSLQPEVQVRWIRIVEASSEEVIARGLLAPVGDRVDGRVAYTL